MNRHTQRMNKVVAYIESTLDEEIGIKTLAGIAFYSEFHFQRLFRLYVGESVYAFRKRLLLERAVKWLQYSDRSITQIAFDSGYDNHSSFNKSFKKQFGHSPTDVRTKVLSLTKYQIPKLDEDKSMKVEIVTINEIKVIAARGIGIYEEIAPEAWGRIMKFAYGNGLMEGDVRRFGISHDDPNVTEPDKIRYDACLDLDVDISQGDNLKNMTIAGGKYAKVMHVGSYDDLDQTYSYIFNQWLPMSGYELRIDPCFDWYLNKDPRRTKPENLKTWVHIPLKS